MRADGGANNSITNQNPSRGNDSRDRIAIGIIQFSVGVFVFLGILAGIAMAPLDSTKRFDLLQYIFAAVVPVIGTWMGTVLAFYFSKENLDAANRSVSALVKHITSNEKLQSITARQAMIPRARITFHTLPSTTNLSEVKLSTLLKLMHEKGVSRLPILDENGVVQFLFHRSVLDWFIADKALSGQPINPPPVFGELSLNDLVHSDSPKIKQIIEQAWQFVKPESTLAEAQEKMEKTGVCQDVFVTQNGTTNEPIIGWITNITIAEHARV